MRFFAVGRGLSAYIGASALSISQIFFAASRTHIQMLSYNDVSLNFRQTSTRAAYCLIFTYLSNLVRSKIYLLCENLFYRET